MKIRAFGELVIELMGRNDQDFLVDERVAIATAQTIFGKLMQDKLDRGENIANFFIWDIFEVKLDSRIGQQYIQPFPKIMNIGDNDGIGQIGHVFNEYEGFLLVKTTQQSQYSLLEAGKFGGRIAARPEGDKIYVINLPETTEVLRLKYLPQLLDLPEDSDMFQSSELDALVLDLTLQKLGYKVSKPESKLDDNISN